MLFGNMAFFSNILEVYPVKAGNILFLLSLGVVFGCFIVFLLSLVCFKYTIKPVLIVVLMVSSFASYFMDSYNVILSDDMIANALQTNFSESADLLSWKLVLYVLLLGVLPSFYVYRVQVINAGFKSELGARLKLIVSVVVIGFGSVLALGDFYSSFFREHKQLRFYANPSYYVYSSVKYSLRDFNREESVLKVIGEDASIPPADVHRELVVMVVGETARYDRFSLNGYSRETNPLLKDKGVLSYTNVWSCGTSTAVSVPCMFSTYGRSDFDGDKADVTENLLDVLRHAGVNVLWLDNNSSSKGVADRVENQDYRSSSVNPDCDVECRDAGMLARLQEYVDQHPVGDIFIVLHQMGNHGPAYYKRYPKAFERFTPVCRSNQLESCSREEIDNTYDNAILYTDYFLSKVIELLDDNAPEFESAMLYVSDHGESLGEGGIYLHGLPYMIAPEEQKHVPLIFWFSDLYALDDVDLESVKLKTAGKYSHDNIFHTVLGLLEVDVSVYDASMDMIDHVAE